MLAVIPIASDKYYLMFWNAWTEKVLTSLVEVLYASVSISKAVLPEVPVELNPFDSMLLRLCYS